MKGGTMKRARMSLVSQLGRLEEKMAKQMAAYTATQAEAAATQNAIDALDALTSVPQGELGL